MRFLTGYKGSLGNSRSFELGIYFSAPKKPHQVLSLSTNFVASAMKYEHSGNCLRKLC